MERTNMDLKLELELKESEVVVNQSIPLHLKLTNDEKTPRKIPYLMDSGKVTNFVLFNEKDEKIGEYNGINVAQLQGMRPDTKLSLVELGAGESWVWDVDLHAYITPLAPGTYTLQSVYRYDAEDLELTSSKEKLVILPNHPTHLDVLRDQVMVGMVYSLFMHKDEKSNEEKLLINMGYDTIPGSYLFGCTLNIGALVKPLISKVDFCNAMDFDHDTYRWLAWTNNGSIFVSSVFRNNIKLDPKEVASDLESATLIPRPIQHSDKGVSLYVKTAVKNGFEIIKIDIDEAGNETTRSSIIELDENPEPIFVSATYTGETHLVWGADGKIPIKWLKIDEKAIGKPKSLLPSEKTKKKDETLDSMELAFLQTYLPMGPPENHSILSLLVSKELDADKKEIGVRVNLVRIMIETENQEVIWESNFLIEGDLKELMPIAGNMIQDRNLKLVGIFETNDGKLYYVSPAGEMNNIMDLEPTLAQFSVIVQGRKGSIELFYLQDEAGIKVHTLVPRLL
jgi:hypothetical protein